MSKLISGLLGASEPQFSYFITDLERSAGRPSIDVRLTAIIIARVKEKIALLNLDPKDTTVKELYHGLNLQLKKDEKKLRNILSVDEESDAEKICKAVAELARSVPTAKSLWVLKNSAVRRLLKQHEPTKTMKLLRYKSVDSLLKREDITELYAGMQYTEDDRWLKAWHKLISSLPSVEFESRPVEVITLNSKRWTTTIKKITNEGRTVLQVPEAGIIALVPYDLPEMSVYSVLQITSVLHALSEVREFSSYCKHKQMEPNFRHIYIQLLNVGTAHAGTIHGHHVPWSAMHRFYGVQDTASHPSFFEPHVQPEDLRWQSVESTLQYISADLSFWQETHYLGARSSNGIVSMHINDVAINTSFNLEFGNHTVAHMQASLWNELIARYLGEAAVEQILLRQLDSVKIIDDALIL